MAWDSSAKRLEHIPDSEVDFGEFPVRVEVHASEETVEDLRRGRFRDACGRSDGGLPSSDVPRHLFSEATGEAARRAAKKASLMFWLSAAKWIGTGAGVSGAIFIALNLGIVVYGFALFFLSSLLWDRSRWSNVSQAWRCCRAHSRPSTCSVSGAGPGAETVSRSRQCKGASTPWRARTTSVTTWTDGTEQISVLVTRVFRFGAASYKATRLDL